MAKSKERSELEALRAENKTLKKQVKHYKKEMIRKTKREHQYEDLEEREAEALLKEQMEEQKVLKRDECPKCGASGLTILGGSKIKILLCDECGHRASRKS